MPVPRPWPLCRETVGIAAPRVLVLVFALGFVFVSALQTAARGKAGCKTSTWHMIPPLRGAPGLAEADAMFEAREVIHAAAASNAQDLPPIRELPLPADFFWGTATAAYQVEGAARLDGKGPSIWDDFSHQVPSRTNGEHADVTCDHYHQMPRDVALMASFGVDVYRFSISWSRVIPLGGRDDPVNEQGIAFYNRLIDALLAHNIRPSVTLYHWDLPQKLQERYQGMLNGQEFRTDFERYARLCFQRFGDRVKEWVTFNEPYVISVFGFHTGILAPGRNTTRGGDGATEPWKVGHTAILAHASVAKLFHEEFKHQGGKITIVLNGHFFEPFDVTKGDDRAAAQRRMEFYIGWFGDPIFLGMDYPPAMRAQLGDRLPTFSPADMDLLRQTAPLNSFYGMNHYSTKFARARTDPPPPEDVNGNVDEMPVDSNGQKAGPVSGVTWLQVAPIGFRKLLNWVWERYKLPIIVTENGCPCPGEANMPKEEALQDAFRVGYMGLYLDAISRAIYEDGVTVRGYYAWSFMDNYEWSSGYSQRFGIMHTDYKTLERTPKKSAYYLKQSFQERRKQSPSSSL